jgi:hypothetical protein
LRDRVFLLLYAAAVLLATSVHDLRLLAGLLALAFLLAGRGLPRLAGRAALALLLFNGLVTLSYAALALYRGDFSWRYVALVNLRAFLVTFLTLLAARRIDPFAAFGFSRTLLYLLTLVYSQTLTLRRLFGEFTLALKSRTIGRPPARDLYRHGAAASALLMRKSLHDAADIAQAMRSRGFQME